MAHIACMALVRGQLVTGTATMQAWPTHPAPLTCICPARTQNVKACTAAHPPGTADGAVSTVNMEGSGWSKDTALTGQNLARSYL